MEQINLEEFVKNATWRELLLELVETNKLDPWDIDISKVVDGYIGIVKKMKVLDLHIPANIIFAASILLRLKSDTLKTYYVQVEEPQPEEIAAGPRVYPEVPSLTPRVRAQPSKKITLAELMSALSDAMKLKERRELYFQEISTPVEFFIDKEDIDTKAEHIFSMVRGSLDGDGLTTFAHLANGFTNTESILLDLFIPLLFLTCKNRVDMAQDKFFDEIFISVPQVS